MSRPRPVLIYGCVIAVLGVLTESADAADVIPGSVLVWLRLALAVLVGVGGALFVQDKVTPLSDPQAADGRRLVPTPPARVPEHATRRDLDAT